VGEPRRVRGSFISANGFASHRISVIDALVPAKRKGQAMVINPALTTALFGDQRGVRGLEELCHHFSVAAFKKGKRLYFLSDIYKATGPVR
jgi:hypothetical protein